MNNLLEIRKKHSGSNQLSEELYLTLSEAMTTGVLSPGDRVYEEQLASLFDVSRTPVREAIKKLETEGMVRADFKQGFHVSAFTSYECEELVQAIEMIRQIATRSAATSITQTYLMRLQDNLEQMSILPQDAVNERLMLNEAFHDIIVASLGNHTINKAYRSMMKKYFLIYANKAEKMTYAMEAQIEHANIYAALQKHAPDEAFMLAVKHSMRGFYRVKLLQT